MRKFLVYYTILAYTVIIAYLLIDLTFYIPLLGILYASPFLMLLEKINKRDWPLIILMLTITMTAVSHPEVFRLSTVAYSLMFIFSYLYYTKILPRAKIDDSKIEHLLKKIIVAYAVVLLIQDISMLAGLPIINWAYEPGREVGFKLNALSYEPSHTGPIVTILMYTYIKLRELKIGHKASVKELFKTDKLLVICYLYTIFFSFSVTCLLGVFILTLYFVKKKYLLPGFLTIIVVTVLFFSLGTETGDRILTLIPALLTFDAQLLFEVDSSSTARIGPYIVYLQEFDISSFNCWFGYGCDYGGLHLMRFLSGNENAEENIGVGGIVNFMYDYGLIAFGAFIFFVYKLCKFKSFEFLIYMGLFFISGFNVYLTWLFFIMVYTIKYYQTSHISLNLNKK